MSDEVEPDSLDEIARLLAVLIRQGSETQTAAILALHDVGLSNARIGQLLGTSTATARVTVNNAKK